MGGGSEGSWGGCGLYLGYNPWVEAQASGSGECVAGVSTSLDLEREAADLVVGVGERGDGGEVVHGDGAAAEHEGLGLLGGEGGHGRWAAAPAERRGGRIDRKWRDVQQRQHHFFLFFMETIK